MKDLLASKNVSAKLKDQHVLDLADQLLHSGVCFASQ
jgi:hypothetical protein